MHRSLLFFVVACPLVGCGDTDDHVPARAASLAKNPIVPALPASSDPAPSGELVQRTIDEARALSRAGAHGSALAAFDRALALDPRSPRLRCEAGYVAHLAGDEARAQDDVIAALRAFEATGAVSDEQRVPVAMCLYNAALVFEANGRVDVAVDALTRSLALRENASVRARLEALAAARGAPASPPGVGAARDRAFADACSQSSGTNAGGCRLRRTDDELSDDTLVALTEESPSGAAPRGLEARIATAVATIDLGLSSVAYLEVGDGGSKRVGLLGRAWEPGDQGMSGELSVERFEWIDVVPGGRPELVVEVAERADDEDTGICHRSGTSRRTVVLCGTDDGALRCASLLAEARTYDETYEGCEDANVRPRTRERGHALTYAFAGGTLQLAPEPDAREGVPRAMPRARPVAAWLADPAFAWPRPAPIR